MTRVWWSIDQLDALVIAALLRSEEIRAHVHYRHVMTAMWHNCLAYGGYQVMVSPSQAGEALALIDAYRRGDLQPVDDVDIAEPNSCLRCGSGTPVLRRTLRWATLALILLSHPTMMAVTPRYRCSACGARWRGCADVPFHRLSRLHDDAVRTP